jgi:general secretion pathway protein K
MVTIFVLAALAGALALSMKVETKLARNASYESELEWAGRSGVELACWILCQQLTDPNEPYDALNQIWAGGPGSAMSSNGPLAQVSLIGHKLGMVTYDIKITDLERKFNINTVAMSRPAVLEQAFIQMGADAGEYPAVISAIQDWVDTDSSPHIGGAENEYYQGLTPAYSAKNGPIDDISELLLIKGVTPEMYYGTSSTNYTSPAGQKNAFGKTAPTSYLFGLRDVFTPLSNGKVNVNTAPQDVLQLIPGLDPNIVPNIIKLRAGPDGVDGNEDDTPLRNVGELSTIGVGGQVMSQMQTYLTQRSQTFEVVVIARVGSYTRQYHAIVGRTDQKTIQILLFYWKAL